MSLIELARLTIVVGVFLRPVNFATAQPTCSSPSVDYGGDVCLDLSAATDISKHHATIDEQIGKTLERIQTLMPLDSLKVAVISDAERTIPCMGIGGYTSGRHDVQIFLDPDFDDLQSVLLTELAPMFAHESHHAMRMRTVNYGYTVLEASISEGLADHFAIEVTGTEPPRWSTYLSAAELEIWIPEVESRSSGDYEHSEWFFGSTPDIPVWTGYSVGYELVRRYLEQHTDSLPSTLHDEPAASFVLE